MKSNYVRCPSCRRKGKSGIKEDIKAGPCWIKCNWRSTGFRALFGNLEAGFRYKMPVCCNLYYSWWAFTKPLISQAITMDFIHNPDNTSFRKSQLSQEERVYIKSKTGIWYE